MTVPMGLKKEAGNIVSPWTSFQVTVLFLGTGTSVRLWCLKCSCVTKSHLQNGGRSLANCTILYFSPC